VKLLIIRPQPGADATARRVRDAGFEPVIMSLFTIEPLPWEMGPLAHYDAVLLTSGNTVRAAGDALKQLVGLPIYAVGAATARALEQLALQPAYVGTDGVDALIGTASDGGHKKLLWLAGEEHSTPQPRPGIDLDIRMVYRSKASSAPVNFADSVRQSGAVMLHSSIAARHFASLCDATAIARYETSIAAFSQSIADSAGEGWATVVVARQPNDSALLSEVQRRFTTVTRDP
jgi:uroporphyrinogen-III synthase